ncbi:MAG: hypothetical protein NTU53_14305, partial [Planctomycetota bacterium]|nr:hypothetical protein [Planctomycetota bacterium]
MCLPLPSSIRSWVHRSSVIVHRFSLLLLPLLSLACSSKPKATPTLAQQIPQAHGLNHSPKQTALQGTLILQMESLPTLEATFTLDLATGHIRLDLADKSTLIFDGQHAYVSPPTAPYNNTRATYLAYTSLLAIPFRLDDSSAHLTDLGPQTLGSASYSSARLTFSSGTPGRPDDSYLLFADPKSHRLQAIAYSLALAKTPDESTPSPRAVTFYDYKPTDGLLVPLEWKFWKYHKTEGLYAKPIGSVRLLNLSTITPKPAL